MQNNKNERDKNEKYYMMPITLSKMSAGAEHFIVFWTSIAKRPYVNRQPSPLSILHFSLLALCFRWPAL
jgi:hypothetical protein